MNDNDSDNNINSHGNGRAELGILVGDTRPDKVFFESKRPVSIGEYVALDYGKGRVLGLIENSKVSSDALRTDIRNFDEAYESSQVALENKRDKSYRGTVRILGYVEELKKCKSIIPALPAEPGTRVYEATLEDLAAVFSTKGPEWIRAGTLLRNSEVDARVNADKVVSRHLAILAMTGMGKSNLVSLVAKELGKIPGTVVIFDYHGDYSTLDIPNLYLTDARINPRYLSLEKLADVIEIQENASNQRHVLRAAFTQDVKDRRGEDFWDALSSGVAAERTEKAYREASDKVLDKIDDAKNKFKKILDPGMLEPLSVIKNGRINVINLVELTERQANVLVSYYLEEILNDRKRAENMKKDPKSDALAAHFPAPVLVVIEEAHVFIPKDEDTETKYFASKVAREGRKFGVGLVIVSQRPRGIDSNILSQMGSLAVMRMIQPDDQMHVSASSESLSRDLIDQLTSLNPGEAIFAGQWVNLPTFVRVDEVKERTLGSDLKAVEQWRKLDGSRRMAKESSDTFIPSGYIQD
jgi:DNA helicase HerA-like ATPase